MARGQTQGPLARSGAGYTWFSQCSSIKSSSSVAYFIETISPLLICAAAAAFTLVGVSKLRRPICQTYEPRIWRRPFFQPTHIVIFTPHPSCPLGSTGDIWEFFPAGELGRVRIKRYRHGGLVGRQEVGDLSQASPCYGGTVRHIGNYNNEGVDTASRESDFRKPYRQIEAFCPAQEGLTMMITARIRGSCSRLFLRTRGNWGEEAGVRLGSL